MSENNHEKIAAGLRATMRRVASTVSIITTNHNGSDYGITATSVTSVCLSPPVILACINQSTRLYNAVLAAGYFTANYLADHQAGIAQVFRTPNTPDRFSTGHWNHGEYGPFLVDAMGVLNCELSQSFTFGTHSILIGKVVRTSAREADPLVYFEGEFSRIVKEPQAQ